MGKHCCVVITLTHNHPRWAQTCTIMVKTAGQPFGQMEVHAATVTVLWDWTQILLFCVRFLVARVLMLWSAEMSACTSNIPPKHKFNARHHFACVYSVAPACWQIHCQQVPTGFLQMFYHFYFAVSFLKDWDVCHKFNLDVWNFPCQLAKIRLQHAPPVRQHKPM